MDMKKVYEDSRYLGINQPQSTYNYDLHEAANDKYNNFEYTN